tara:strand:- start:243 stop:995 length:753 start_codon:yes stop_codon:yes gene_type:complete
MNVIIIDNDIEARNSLPKFLRLFCTNINIIACTESPNEGLKIIQSSDPDIIFIDNDIYKNNNFFMGMNSSKKIFYTVLLSYGDTDSNNLGTFKTKLLEFLPKPIDTIALVKCVNNVRNKLKHQLCPDYRSLNKYKKAEEERIGIPTSKGIQFLPLNRIIYFKANNNYTEIIIEHEKPILVSKTLKSFEELLIGTFFMRVHQSYLVNLTKVIELQRLDGGALILENNIKIPISRANKQQINERLKAGCKVI